MDRVVGDLDQDASTRHPVFYPNTPPHYRENLEEEFAIGIPLVLPEPVQEAVGRLGRAGRMVGGANARLKIDKQYPPWSADADLCHGRREPPSLLEQRVQEFVKVSCLAQAGTWRQGSWWAFRKQAETLVLAGRSPFASDRETASPLAHHHATLTWVLDALTPDLLHQLFRVALAHVFVPNLDRHGRDSG